MDMKNGKSNINFMLTNYFCDFNKQNKHKIEDFEATLHILFFENIFSLSVFYIKNIFPHTSYST